MNTTLPEPLATAGFTPEQKEYLSGLFAGTAARGQKFSDVEPAPTHEDLRSEHHFARTARHRRFHAGAEGVFVRFVCRDRRARPEIQRCRACANARRFEIGTPLCQTRSPPPVSRRSRRSICPVCLPGPPRAARNSAMSSLRQRTKI